MNVLGIVASLLLAVDCGQTINYVDSPIYYEKNKIIREQYNRDGMLGVLNYFEAARLTTNKTPALVKVGVIMVEASVVMKNYNVSGDYIPAFTYTWEF